MGKWKGVGSWDERRRRWVHNKNMLRPEDVGGLLSKAYYLGCYMFSTSVNSSRLCFSIGCGQISSGTLPPKNNLWEQGNLSSLSLLTSLYPTAGTWWGQEWKVRQHLIILSSPALPQPNFLISFPVLPPSSQHFLLHNILLQPKLTPSRIIISLPNLPSRISSHLSQLQSVFSGQIFPKGRIKWSPWKRPPLCI